VELECVEVKQFLPFERHHKSAPFFQDIKEIICSLQPAVKNAALDL